jgi:hypothetical protein
MKMNQNQPENSGRFRSYSLICAVLLSSVLARIACADNVQTTEATLLDRIQIEDLISNYYWDLSSGRHKLSEYYVDDAVLDVNGIVYQGHAGIQSAYDPEGPGGPTGKMHMLMNNPRIRINGDKATAETIWTGVLSDTVRVAPRLFEQGREFDELVKKGGRWYFTKRVITSDAGLTEKYDKTYKQR